MPGPLPRAFGGREMTRVGRVYGAAVGSQETTAVLWAPSLTRFDVDMGGGGTYRGGTMCAPVHTAACVSACLCVCVCRMCVMWLL